MDRRERDCDLQEALLASFQGQQSTIWTALPGIITTTLDPAKRTVSVQTTLRARVQAPDGSYSWVQLPLLVDCPVFFPSGGGVTLTFPIKPGDECLVVFASRCIDAWWQLGGIQNQPDLRMHDLSDGFVFAGFSSVPKVIPAISATTAQLRSDDGGAYIELDPTTQNITVSTFGDVVIEADGDITLNSSGIVSINSAGLFHNGVNIGSTHIHGGVQPGGGTTSGPS